MTTHSHGDLASQFTSPNLNREKVRVFAKQISDFEVQSGLKAKHVLVNGIPPFDDVPTVEFEVPKNDIAAIIKSLFSRPNFDPHVIINGIPSVEHFNVKVVGRP